MKKLFAIACLFSMTTAIAAQQIYATDDLSGRIEIVESGAAYLRMKEQPLPLKILLENMDVEMDFETLTSGDQIVGEGLLKYKEGEVHLHTITAVGIQRIVGNWVDEIGQGFNFWDFDLLYVSEDGNTRKWSYELFPVDIDVWTIQMESSGMVEVGRLKLVKSEEFSGLLLEYIDSITGDVSRTVHLRKFTP